MLKSLPTHTRRLNTLISQLTPRRSSAQPRFLTTSAMTSPELSEREKAVGAEFPDAAITLFDKILKKEIPSDKVYEDDLCYAFKDINPIAPFHVLLIPKERNGLTQMRCADETKNKELLGHLLIKAGEIGQKNCPDGFRIINNDGKDAGQTVGHLHLHILGGRNLTWTA